MRVAALILAAAALVPRPAPDGDKDPRLAPGVLRRNGVLLPFASYDGSWSVTWPYAAAEFPISLDDVPKKWWGAPGREAPWTAWLDGTRRPLKLEKPVAVPVFCDTRLGIRTDYVGVPPDRPEPTVAK